MDATKTANRREKILMMLYSSSMDISVTALTVVCILEVLMLLFSIAHPSLYRDSLLKYQILYLSLLILAIAYIALNIFVKKDIERRYVLLHIANPLYAVLFFAWSLCITYSDATINGVVDPAVFMTFSLTVLLTFFLLPAVYATIVVIMNSSMITITVVMSDSIGQVINLSIFLIFQFVLGISFLRMKIKLTEHIVDEQEKADKDVMTGFLNRRRYVEDTNKIAESPLRDDMVYLAIDINGLKKINDSCGHKAGDKLIVGAARCMAQCFGHRGTMYRIGGDEFVVLLAAGQDELENLLINYEESMRSWSADNGMLLRASYGCVASAEHPDKNIHELAGLADERMYAAKARYYQMSGRDRRNRRPA